MALINIFFTASAHVVAYKSILIYQNNVFYLKLYGKMNQGYYTQHPRKFSSATLENAVSKYIKNTIQNDQLTNNMLYYIDNNLL